MDTLLAFGGKARPGAAVITTADPRTGPRAAVAGEAESRLPGHGSARQRQKSARNAPLRKYTYHLAGQAEGMAAWGG